MIGQADYKPRSRNTPVEARELIKQAKSNLQKALRRWKNLRDPEPTENNNFKHPETGEEYNFRAFETYRVLQDVAGGMLTQYPLSANNSGVEHAEPEPIETTSVETKDEQENAVSSPTVFISYSHKDEEWKDRVCSQLGVLAQQGLVATWDDRRIAVGDDWQPKIEKAMASAKAAVLLISANFLTSNFILKSEVPTLLEKRDKEGVRVIPVIVKPCAWQTVPWLARLQCRPRGGRPLSAGDENQIEQDLADLALEINSLLNP